MQKLFQSYFEFMFQIKYYYNIVNVFCQISDGQMLYKVGFVTLKTLLLDTQNKHLGEGETILTADVSIQITD